MPRDPGPSRPRTPAPEGPAVWRDHPVDPNRVGHSFLNPVIHANASGRWRETKRIQQAKERKKRLAELARRDARVMLIELHPEHFTRPVEAKARMVNLTPKQYRRIVESPKFLLRHREAADEVLKQMEGYPKLMLLRRAMEGHPGLLFLYAKKMQWFKEDQDVAAQRAALRIVREFLTGQRDDLPDPTEMVQRQLASGEHPEEEDHGEGQEPVREDPEPDDPDAAPGVADGPGRADDGRMESAARGPGAPDEPAPAA